MTLQFKVPSREGAVSVVLLTIALLFNLTQLFSEVATRAPAQNDDVLHLLTLGQTVAAMLMGRDPTDFWLGTVDLGYPLFHYYQHLSIVLPAALDVLFLRAFGQPLPLDLLLSWVTYLLLSLFPLSIYWSMRRFGFARVTAALAGLVASLLSTNGLYGFDFGSYIWIGHGLYTQLWAMVLLPPTLALGCCALRDGRGYLWAVLFLAATILCNLIYGYIAGASLVLFALLRVSGRDVGRIAARLAILLGLGVLTVSYFVVPFLGDGAYMNRSVWELTEKYDSYGLSWVLGALVRGDLFDYGRFPSLTILAGVGVIVCFWRWRDARYRVPLALGALWLLLYFGRPTWGGLLDLLPLSRDLQLHRLIGGIHLAGIYLIGVGLAVPWRWALARREARSLLAPAALTVLLLYPVYAERATYLAANARFMAASQKAYQAEQKDVDALVSTLRSLPPGRVYAGLGANWGKQYQIGDVPVYALLQDAGADMLGYLYHALSLNADIEVLFNDSRPDDYNLFDVRYVVAPIGQPVPAFLTPLKDFGRHRLYQAPTTGYFDLVGADVTFAGDPRDWYPVASRWLASDQPRLKENPAVRFDGVAVDYERVFPLAKATALVPPGTLPNEPSRGRIVAEAVGSDGFQADVVVERPSTLMLKESYHPGWRARVDGAEVGTAMVLPSYVGVSLAPGAHRVQLTYQPGLLHGYLMILGLLTLLATGAVEWWRARKYPAIFHAPDEADEPDVLGDLTGAKRALGWLGARLKGAGAQAVAGHTANSSAAVPIAVAEDGVRGLAARSGSPKSTASPWSFRTKLGIYLLFLSVYLASTPGHFISTDHVAVYLTSQSLVERHNLAIKRINDTIQGIDGQYYARYQPLQSVLSIPLYLIGRAVDRVSSPDLRRYLSGPNLSDWGGTVPIFVVDLFDPLVTPLTCLLFFLFGWRLGFSAAASLATTLVFGFATGTWVYAREYFQHPLETLLLLSAIYILFANRERLTPRQTFFAGSALALGVLTRINVAIVAPLVLLYVFSLVPILRQHGITLARLRGMSRRDLLEGPVRYAVAFGGPIVVVLAILLWLNERRFGSFFEFGPNAYDRGFSTPLWVGLYGYLFTPGRSIFLYSPPLILGLVGFGRFFRQHRSEAVLFVGIVAAYLVVYSTFGYWAGGWSWGPRYLLPIIPFLTLPVAYYFDREWRAAMVGILALLGVGVQVLGVAVNYSYVTWDWIDQKLNPPDAYLYVPEISPIPTHLADLIRGRDVDVWLLWVDQHVGFGVFVLTLAVPVALFAVALALLRDQAGAFWRSRG
jgi:hypothetical protein